MRRDDLSESALIEVPVNSKCLVHKVVGRRWLLFRFAATSAVSAALL